MKMAGAQAARYLAQPDPARPGLLIFGADAMRVALKRQEVVAALVGPEGEAEMRLTRMSGGDLRRDPAEVMDAMRAQGFFPGPRVVFVEEATDGAAPALVAALKDWRAGDAVLVVTAGNLGKGSALRKGFEDHPQAVAIGLYDDPPSREEVEAMLRAAGFGGPGLPLPGREALADLMALALALDPGDLRQTIERMALYKLGDAQPLTPAEIALLAPATFEAEVDEALNAAAEQDTPRLVLLMRRLDGQGTAPTSICIAAIRHFRALHSAAADPGGAAAGIGKLRPPVFGPRRDRMLRQAQAWGAATLERALAEILDTDLRLRSTSRAPGMALAERMLMRLAAMPGRRQG
ncbi:MAG: hypothetical protein RLZZ528_201 [Pseudomonadota bacterium]